MKLVALMQGSIPIFNCIFVVNVSHYTLIEQSVNGASWQMAFVIVSVKLTLHISVRSFYNLNCYHLNILNRF